MKRSKHVLGGLSMPLNSLAIVLQFIGILCLLATQLKFISNLSTLFWVLAVVLIGISIPVLILFKGGTLLTYYGRIALGFVLLVISILQASSVDDFALFIERYAMDASVASHVKTWAGLESFGFGFFAEHSKGVALTVIVLEFVCAIGVLIGGFVRANGIILSIITGWFALCFLHSSFSSSKTFVDENTYELKSKEGIEAKKRIDKKDKTISYSDISENTVTIQETVSVDKVRNKVDWKFVPKTALTNNMNLDTTLIISLLLLYFSVLCAVFGNRIYANSVKLNWAIIPILTVFAALISIFIHWYALLFFVPIVLLACLVMYRSGGRFLANHVGTILVSVIFIILFLNLHSTLGLKIQKKTHAEQKITSKSKS